MAGGLLYNRQSDKPGKGGSEIPATSKIDYSPGTAADQKVADAKKGTSAPTTSSATTATVTPILSYVNQDGNKVIVNAYIPGIVETGGVCTLHASLGSSSLTPPLTARTFIASSYTSCVQFSIPTSSFPRSGNWSFTVSYSSVKYSGTSQVSNAEVSR